MVANQWYRGVMGLVLLAACGVPESQYEAVVHDLFCERVAECNGLLTKEECLLSTWAWSVPTTPI